MGVVGDLLASGSIAAAVCILVAEVQWYCIERGVVVEASAAAGSASIGCRAATATAIAAAEAGTATAGKGEV